MLKGEKTRLRRLTEADADVIFPHWNRYELRQYLPSPLPSTLDDVRDMIRSANEKFAKRTAFTFGIETIESGHLIGFINLDTVSWVSRHAFVGVFAVVDPDVRGKGYGKDAMLQLLDFGFHMLDLHVIALWVETFNESAVKFYEKIGFSNRGTIRELAYRNGKREDVTVMDLLKTEFADKYGILPKE